MFGQIPDFTNGFEFLRNLWGSGSGMPGGLMPGLQAMTPPMDLDEVDKRIHDLKAVESWLQLNTNLLRTTIQGLEVQRATLVALQTFGNALSPDAMQSAMENVARAANAPSAAPHHHTFAMPGHEPEDVGAMDAEEEDEDYDYAADDRAADDDNTEALPDDEAPADAAAAAGEEGAGSDASAVSGTEAGGDALPPNAALWWNLLQQQFNQIASSAAAASIAPFGNLGGFGTGAATDKASAQPASSPDARGTAQPAKGRGKASGKGGTRTGKGGMGKAAAGKAAAKKTAARSGTGTTSSKTATPTSARTKPATSRQATRGAPAKAPRPGRDTSGGDDTA